jgi:hypothetical protein
VTSVDQLKAAALRQIAAIDREYAEFNTRCLALIDRTLGRGHAYYEQALREVQREPMTSAELAASLHGLVRSLKVDIEADALATVRETGHADLLAMFLRMAENLLGAHRKDPAAVLLGGALEAKHHVAMADEERGPSAPLAEELNEMLAQQVYGLTEFKSVVAWLELREKASRWAVSAYNHDDVAKFLRGLRAFIASFPA